MKLQTLLIFLPIFGFSEFAGDLNKVIEHFECDPLCTFNHSEINSDTIRFFPKCAEVCGILIMNENLDLDEHQLRETFSTMEVLSGGIGIEKTQLTSLNFFNVDNHFKEFSIFCETYGVFIKNNAKLRGMEILQRLYLYGDMDGNECEFRIEYNEQLSTTAMCESSTEFWNMRGHFDLRSNWNLEDCACRQDELITITSLGYKHCRYMYGGLRLQNYKDPNELIALEGVRKINGPLIVENTALVDFGVLDTLDSIETSVLKNGEPAFINIKNNPQMRELAMLNLMELYGNRIVNLENLHPEFCLTIELMRVFMEFGSFFIHLDVAGYCKEDSYLFNSRNSLCASTSLAELEFDCGNVLGDLIIGPGEEYYVNRLEKLERIFGRLVVNNTELEDLSFLGNLKSVVVLDEYPPIQITGNLKLKNATLPKIENLITNGSQYVLLEDNHPDLPTSENYLQLFSEDFQKWINYTNEYIVPLRVVSDTEGNRIGFWIGLLAGISNFWLS